jgi:hypothetical protein
MVLRAMRAPARAFAISLRSPEFTDKARKTVQIPGLATFRRASAAAPMEYY